MRIDKCAVGADHQHPRAVPRVCWLERDPVSGKNEIEGVDAHRGHRHPVKAVNLLRKKGGRTSTGPRLPRWSSRSS